MENLAHANLFFLVTTIFVGVLTVGLVVAIFYLVKLLRALNGIVDDGRRELATITTYVDDQLKSSQSKVGSAMLVAEGLMRLYGSFSKSKSSKQKTIAVKKKK